MMTNNTGILIQVSNHIFLYRGFTIHKCPIHSKTKRRAYQIMNDGFYLGREFSSSEVEKTINEIIRKARG